LLKAEGKLKWLNVDWNNYIDEDDDDGGAGMNFGGGSDFPNMPVEDEDSDDKEDIKPDEKPKEGDKDKKNSDNLDDLDKDFEVNKK